MSESEASSALAGDLSRASRALDALRDAFERRYGQAVFDVRPEAGEVGLRLVGHVLVASQKADALAAVDAAVECAVTESIAVLAEAPRAYLWLAPARPVVDLLRAPDGPRETQIVPGDAPALQLEHRAGWRVIELPDDTIGWCSSESLRVVAATQAPADMATWRVDFRGRARPAAEAEWRAAIAPWLGTPYLWGGTTPLGVDCSGLTQRLYRIVIGIGLPKHSAAQMRCGRRISLAEASCGDLVGLTHLETGVGHVAAVIGGHPPEAVHASIGRSAVVVEPLSALLARYQFRGARRFDPWATP